MAQIISIIISLIVIVIAFIAILIPPAIAILINVIISKHMEKAAMLKGHYKVHAFAMCFWLGLPGYLYVAALPDVKQQDYLESIINLMQTKGSTDTSELDPKVSENK